MKLMIDIETLNTETDSVVTEIGYAFFKGDGNHPPIASGSYNLNVQDQLDKGRSISSDTLNFWIQTDSDSLRSYLSYKDRNRDNKQILQDLINKLNNITDVSKVEVWTKGIDFDLPILKDLFKTYDLEYPFSFRNHRDFRTFAKIHPEIVHKTKNTHNALYDCLNQINHFNKIINGK